MAGERLWIIGPGRVGLALGAMLHRAGAVESLAYTGRSPDAPAHPLFEASPPAEYLSGWALPDPPPTGILITVPDGAVGEVAVRLASLPLPSGIPVLHTSGVLGSAVLAPLRDRGVRVGSIHPLAAVSGPDAGVDRLRGAWFAVEGDPEALRLAGLITTAASGRAITLPTEGKALYHAAAVIASNYVVTLLAVAERLALRAGLPEPAARAALAELAAGAIANVAADGPVRALTGPIARGDSATVERHIAELSGSDLTLYSVLARETLALAGHARPGDVEGSRLARLLGGEGE